MKSVLMSRGSSFSGWFLAATTQINKAELSQCSLEFVNAASYPDTCKSRQGATGKKSEEDSTIWRLLQEDV
ncbi:unnamed protein product [Sphagnum troendelagicum]|uniref:Uncharacterized protein n=1 Tax=Sphagnum troendelagicum TaxID=128251 RepID=A0ABP0UM48_9BRYO